MAKREERQAGSAELLRTAQLLARSGITHQVLYRYTTLGLVEAASRTASGQRLFHPSAVTLIEIIQSLNRSGYSLRDIKEIFFKDERVRKVMAEAKASARKIDR